MIKYIVVALLLLAMPCFAQAECDINRDGYEFTIQDLIYLIICLNGSPDLSYLCDIDCDLDGDSNQLTIADMVIFVNLLTDPDYPDNAPDFSRHPDSDTFIIGSAAASPGDSLVIPVYLNTVDTLTAYEFRIHADTNYIRIDSVASLQGDSLFIVYSERSLHAFSYNFWPPTDSIFLLPGDYHLADIYAHVNPDITEPVITELVFSGCPEESFYTGLANLTFFEPVLINGEITITPVGVDDFADNELPAAISLTASPNPFNAATTISYTLPATSDVTLNIYDVLGQRVERLLSGRQNAGPHQVIWNADQYRSGIYFARLQAAGGSASLKLVLLK